MKVAFMSFSCPELDLDSLLGLAKRLGYDAVEPRTQSGHGHGIELQATPEERRAARDQVEGSGIALCCIAVSCDYADPETVVTHVEETRQALDLAADLGCERLRVFGGKIGGGLSREDAVAHVADALASVAGQAAERGVTICVETHDAWCTPADMAAVMSRVNHPNIAVNWDIMHPVLSGGATMEEAFATLEPWIRHVHVHDGRKDEDGRLELVPIGEGDIDHAAAFQCLRDARYDGAVSGEWIGWEPAEVHLPRELDRLRRLLSHT